MDPEYLRLMDNWVMQTKLFRNAFPFTSSLFYTNLRIDV